MPNAPNIDGLPLWLQIVISLIFLSVTVAVAVQGYNRREPKTLGENAQIIGAQIADVGAFRHLADVTAQLVRSTEELMAETRDVARIMDDSRHWIRQHNELLNETNRLLRAIIDRPH